MRHVSLKCLNVFQHSNELNCLLKILKYSVVMYSVSLSRRIVIEYLYRRSALKLLAQTSTEVQHFLW